MIKSWIYFNFFHYIIENRYQGKDEFYIQGKISNEKIVLRSIAAFKQTYTQIYEKQDVKWYDIESNIDYFKPKETILELKDIDKSFFLIIDVNKQKLVNFIHKSFMEYLIAEYYLESALNQVSDDINQIERFSIGIPSKITIEFLDGLIGLLNSNDDDANQMICNQETGLLNSFNWSDNKNNAKIRMISNLSYSIMNDSIIVNKERSSIIQNNENGKDSQKADNRWLKIKINEIVADEHKSGFTLLWIHRWISLKAIHKIESHDNIKHIV